MQDTEMSMVERQGAPSSDTKRKCEHPVRNPNSCPHSSQAKLTLAFHRIARQAHHPMCCLQTCRCSLKLAGRKHSLEKRRPSKDTRADQHHRRYELTVCFHETRLRFHGNFHRSTGHDKVDSCKIIDYQGIMALSS